VSLSLSFFLFIMCALKSILLVVALYLALAIAHPVHHIHHRVPRAVNNSRPCQDDANGDQSFVVESSSSVKPSPPSQPSPPPKSSGGGVVGSLKALFPVSESKSWTTSPQSNSKISLSDSTFRPHHVLSALSHAYVNAPDGKPAMKAHYPKNSLNFGSTPQGGFSFYAPGPANVDLTTAKEATFGYSVFFEAGFKWVLGGKLPGLCKFLLAPHPSNSLIVSDRRR
jgi:hypothetical protein